MTALAATLSTRMADPATLSADRWAERVITIAAFVLGGIVGVFVAPRVQMDLAPLVDPFSFKPAAVIVLVCALAGAVLARTSFRRGVLRSRR